MSIDTWKWIFDWAAILFVAATFFAGAGALITGRVINDRQEESLRTMKKDLTNKQTELATAQGETAKAQLALQAATYHFTFGRSPGPYPFKALKALPKSSIEIKFKEDDGEAYM